MFAPADTWVSTEYLFRRDQDGDFWLVDNRGAVIHTDRGPVYAMPITDAVGGIDAVDLAVTYAVDAGGRRIAVTALALRPGGSVAAGDLSEALADLPVGAPPDIVHVVPDMELSASYRPLIEPVARRGHSEGCPVTPGTWMRIPIDTSGLRSRCARRSRAGTEVVLGARHTVRLAASHRTGGSMTLQNAWHRLAGAMVGSAIAATLIVGVGTADCIGGTGGRGHHGHGGPRARDDG